ncbi:type 4a pilus biogenesis protein PilO [Patescibacteria group bacterium]|nr:type 4a pilus biogenesis protein PilO [Patescibacteria group bacterium]
METNKNFNKYGNSSGKIPIETELLFLSFVFSLILIFVFVVPKYRQMEISKEQIKLIQENVESKNSVLEKVKDYNEKNKTIREMDLKKFNSLLPERNNVEKYIADINKMADTSGSRVNIGKFSISNPRFVKSPVRNSSLDLRATDISFSVLGDFDNLMSFLDSIEKNVPLMELSSLNIGKIENEDLTRSKIENEEDGETAAKTIFVEANIILSFFYL